jgi:hypothetical protein
VGVVPGFVVIHETRDPRGHQSLFAFWTGTRECRKGGPDEAAIFGTRQAAKDALEACGVRTEHLDRPPLRIASAEEAEGDWWIQVETTGVTNISGSFGGGWFGSGGTSA